MMHKSLVEVTKYRSVLFHVSLKFGLMACATASETEKLEATSAWTHATPTLTKYKNYSVDLSPCAVSIPQRDQQCSGIHVGNINRDPK